MELTVTHSKLIKKAPGKVSGTFDCWQASNIDSYLVVTAHWIETPSDTEWELKGAIIGFIRVNSAHTGEALGRLLFEVYKRIGIVVVVS